MLIDIPSEDVTNLVKVLETELPRSLFIINFLETCHKWMQKNKELDISLLYTRESMKNGVFIGILKSGCQGPLVAAYALDSYENALEEAVHQVQIDWKTIISFEGIAEKHAHIVDNLVTENSLKLAFLANLILVAMPIEEALELDINCPDEVELKPLTEDDLNEIYEVWILKDLFTKEHLKNCLQLNDEAAYGVFCKTTGHLLARCVRSHSGVLAALQTAEKARNKGYAKLLLKYIAKNMAQRGIQPCTYTVDFNTASRRVFRGAGYKEMSRLKSYDMDRAANMSK